MIKSFAPTQLNNPTTAQGVQPATFLPTIRDGLATLSHFSHTIPVVHSMVTDGSVALTVSPRPRHFILPGTCFYFLSSCLLET